MELPFSQEKFENYWIRIFSKDVETDDKIAKISLVGIILLFAARNAILGRRHSRIYQTPADDVHSTLSKLRTSLAAEVTLALAVVGLVAFIGTMSPLGH